MKAADIMTREVITIRGAAPVARAIDVMGQRGVRSLIVDQLHPQDAYGIVTETDIIYKVIAVSKDPQQVRVHEIMTKPCIVINPDLQLEQVARLFLNNGLRVAPVISGTLLGIVSMGDMLAKANAADAAQASLEQQIDAAIARARDLCSQPGSSPQNCITAWQLVEDLQAEAAHRRDEPLGKTAFEQFREDFPEWLNQEDLDIWCSG